MCITVYLNAWVLKREKQKRKWDPQIWYESQYKDLSPRQQIQVLLVDEILDMHH